jgi:hypothetical protein
MPRRCFWYGGTCFTGHRARSRQSPDFVFRNKNVLDAAPSLTLGVAYKGNVNALDTFALAVDHDTLDFVRDTLSAVAGGLVLMAVGGVVAHWRVTKNRMDRIAVEVRHTQKAAGIDPFYEGDL